MGSGKDLSSLMGERNSKVESFAPENRSDSMQVSKNLFYSYDHGYFYQGEGDQVIPRNILKGVVSKGSGFCGPSGTSALAEKMQMDDENPRVSAHILEIDSPGGAVDGTPEFASIMAGMKKPVVSFVDNMAASAAYWIASQTSHIVTNSLILSNRSSDIPAIASSFFSIDIGLMWWFSFYFFTLVVRLLALLLTIEYNRYCLAVSVTDDAFKVIWTVSIHVGIK